MKILKEFAVSDFKNIIVETNFITSFFNKHDSHRIVFEKILKYSENVYIPQTAFKESIKSFKNKLDRIHTFLMSKYLKMDLNRDNSEIYEEEEKILEELNLTFDKSINFNKYLLNVSRDLRLRYLDKTDFLSALTDHVLHIANIAVFEKVVYEHSRSINPELNFYNVLVPNVNKPTIQKRYNKIKNAIEPVNYNDKPDKKLFLNIMYHYPDEYEVPLSFISSDSEFIEKSRLSLIELNNQIDLDTSELKMIYVYDHFEKPTN
jgi:hypothetical protein